MWLVKSMHVRACVGTQYKLVARVAPGINDRININESVIDSTGFPK